MSVAELESMDPSISLATCVAIDEEHPTPSDSGAYRGLVTVVSYWPRDHWLLRRSLRALAVPMLLCAALISAQAQPTSAQDGPLAVPQHPQETTPGESDNPSETDTTGDSPRSMLTRFFELTRRGDYDEAAKFLEFSGPMDPARGSELAKRLRLVLDHYVVFDMNTISASRAGNTGDSLNAAMDEIARLPVGSSTAGVNVIGRKDDTRWRFGKRTVGRIDDWYNGMSNRFWLELTPTPLLNQ